MSIKLDSTSKLYDNKIVIDQISLEILSGEILGLVGPNGAGKTTLLNLMAGDYSSFSGIPNDSGSGKTGDIMFTTIGASNGDTYTVILELLKTY